MMFYGKHSIPMFVWNMLTKFDFVAQCTEEVTDENCFVLGCYVRIMRFQITKVLGSLSERILNYNV